MKKVRSVVSKIILGVNYIALAICFCMVFVVAIDVILRKVGGQGIQGSNELTTFFLVPVCMLGIPALQVKDGHVWVNMFVNKFPYRFRNIWRGVILLVETAIVGLLAYGGYEKVIYFFSKNAHTDILHMPKYLFAVSCLVGFAEFFIICLIDTIQLFIDGASGKEEPKEEGWSDDQVKGI